MKTTTRARADGGTEDIHTFPNGRRARVWGGSVQLLDCRNDEHENRLFPRRDGLDEKGVKKALADIAKLPKPTPHKWDR